MSRNQFDVRHPLFRPLWRRVVFVTVLGAWTVYEVAQANWVWAAIFAVAVAFLIYQWFIVFDPKDYEDP